jgi:hypothetical protein
VLLIRRQPDGWDASAAASDGLRLIASALAAYARQLGFGTEGL